MEKLFTWFNERSFLMILLMFLSSIIVEVLDRAFFPKPIYLGNHPIQGWIFLVACALFLFSIFIFAPLYRKFGVEKTRRIKKGEHFPMKIHFPLIINPNRIFSITKIFNFDKSCLYDFNDNDEHDKNKLFGLSFAIWPRIRTQAWEHKNFENGKTVLIWFRFLGLVVIKPMHWSSVRFCWNTVNKDGKVDIWPYIYNKGIRISNFKAIGTCDPGKDYVFRIDIDKIIDAVIFTKINSEDGERITTNYDIEDTGIMYMYLDLYFGGNRTAPHDITIEEKA